MLFTVCSGLGSVRCEGMLGYAIFIENPIGWKEWIGCFYSERWGGVVSFVMFLVYLLV